MPFLRYNSQNKITQKNWWQWCKLIQRSRADSHQIRIYPRYLNLQVSANIYGLIRGCLGADPRIFVRNDPWILIRIGEEGKIHILIHSG
uniref:Cytotoxic translational repressor of toxin-antitoxin stability system n=1 Tax=Strongyloides venezuelensis TaxID=75913 RepID=A0A0K0G567_STRVS